MVLGWRGLHNSVEVSLQPLPPASFPAFTSSYLELPHVLRHRVRHRIQPSLPLLRPLLSCPGPRRQTLPAASLGSRPLLCRALGSRKWHHWPLEASPESSEGQDSTSTRFSTQVPDTPSRGAELETSWTAGLHQRVAPSSPCLHGPRTLSRRGQCAPPAPWSPQPHSLPAGSSGAQR